MVGRTMVYTIDQTRGIINASQQKTVSIARASLDEHELGYKLTGIFIFQFCDVAILVIIHKRN